LPTVGRRAVARASWAALLAAAGLAWVLTARFASGMPAGPGTMGLELPAFLALWALMMAAMMLPSIAPLVALYARTLRARSTGWTRALRGASLVTGYLAAWVAYGLFAFAAARAGGTLAAHAPRPASWVGAGVLAAAGLYQLTPLKSRCLSRCRSPLGFLMRFGGYAGKLRDLRVGLYHGGYCVGCCWGLMAVLITVGVMNLAWMAGLAGAVLLEKTWRHGKGFGITLGLAMIVFACFVPWHPGLLPGLHTQGGM
jgi:predicted metal-binding membrane protein